MDFEEVKWEVQFRKSGWCPLPPATSKSIETAYQENPLSGSAIYKQHYKKKDCDVYSIDFGTMTQTNLTSDNRRDVRRCIGSSDWQSFKPNGVWQDTQNFQKEEPRARMKPNATEQAGETDASKATEQADESDASGMEVQEVRWEVKFPKSHWWSLPHAASHSIEAAYQENPLGGSGIYKQQRTRTEWDNYSIDFGTMIQTNHTSQNKRAARRFIVSSDWKSFKRDGVWADPPDFDTEELEARMKPDATEQVGEPHAPEQAAEEIDHHKTPRKVLRKCNKMPVAMRQTPGGQMVEPPEQDGPMDRVAALSSFSSYIAPGESSLTEGEDGDVCELCQPDIVRL